MKKIISFVLVLVLFFTSVFTVSAQRITDIAPNHWAYRMVSDLINRGFMSLYDDGSFLGQKEVTRFQLAEALAHILTYLESAEVGLTGTDLQNIRLLTVEFRKELVELTEDMAHFRQRVVALEECRIINYEDMGKMYRKMDEMQLEVSKIINEIVLLYALQKQTDELERDVLIAKSDLSKLQESFVSEKSQIILVEESLEDAQFQLDKLSRENKQMKLMIGGLAGVMAVLFFLNFSGK